EAGRQARVAEVEHLVRLDAGRAELVQRGLNVGDDEPEPLRRSGRGRVPAASPLDRAAGPGRRELEDARAGRRDVLPPAEARIELRGALRVRDGDDDDLELHVDRGAHGSPHWTIVTSALPFYGVYLVNR